MRAHNIMFMKGENTVKQKEPNARIRPNLMNISRNLATNLFSTTDRSLFSIVVLSQSVMSAQPSVTSTKSRPADNCSRNKIS
ncbi:hypothetical protein D3C76_1321580 [compost metagenome]